jgi:hypothetical protein
VGNYLRAEILHRCEVSPFVSARAVLEGALAGTPPLFETTAAVMSESLAILRVHGFTDDADRMKVSARPRGLTHSPSSTGCNATPS